MTEPRPSREDLKATVARRLKARNAAERRFRLYGQVAIALALGFLVLLPFIFGHFSGDEYFIRMSVSGIKCAYFNTHCASGGQLAGMS